MQAGGSYGKAVKAVAFATFALTMRQHERFVARKR